MLRFEKEAVLLQVDTPNFVHPSSPTYGLLAIYPLLSFTAQILLLN